MCSRKSVRIEDGVVTKYLGLFEAVDIPDGVTAIGERAFAVRKGFVAQVKSITIPNSVTSIGEQAFSGCSNLSSITIPKGTKVARNTFGSAVKKKRV